MIEAYTVGAEKNYDNGLAAAAQQGQRMKKMGRYAKGSGPGAAWHSPGYGGGIVFLSVEAARAGAGEYIIRHGYPFAVYTLELESLDQTYVKDADDQRYLLVNVPVGRKVAA
jgi:hypothetical protein